MRHRGKGANPTQLCTKTSAPKGEATAGRVLAESRFSDFDPPSEGGQKSHGIGPGGLAPLRVYQ